MTPRYSNRWHTWLLPGERVSCPKGHPLKHNAAVLQHDAFICQHTIQGGQCGSRVYLLQMPHGLRFVAEVNQVEMYAMRDAAMSVEQAVAYLRGRDAA